MSGPDFENMCCFRQALENITDLLQITVNWTLRLNEMSETDQD